MCVRAWACAVCACVCACFCACACVRAAGVRACGCARPNLCGRQPSCDDRSCPLGRPMRTNRVNWSVATKCAQLPNQRPPARHVTRTTGGRNRGRCAHERAENRIAAHGRKWRDCIPGRRQRPGRHRQRRGEASRGAHAPFAKIVPMQSRLRHLIEWKGVWKGKGVEHTGGRERSVGVWRWRWYGDKVVTECQVQCTGNHPACRLQPSVGTCGRLASAGLSDAARHGKARHSMARHSKARHGTARHGMAWHRKARQGKSQRVSASIGWLMPGPARRPQSTV